MRADHWLDLVLATSILTVLAGVPLPAWAIGELSRSGAHGFVLAFAAWFPDRLTFTAAFDPAAVFEAAS